jgi:hypothetical protein
MIVVFLSLAALIQWAKHLNRWTRIPFWDVKRIRGRYESGALNGIALFLSLVIAPISWLVGLIAIWYLISDKDETSDILLPIAVLIGSPREFFMVLCDLFAERAPQEA